MGYAAAIKWAILAIIIGSVIYIIDDFGYNRAWNKHLKIEEARTEEVNKVIKAEHDLYTQETAKSSAYADFIQGDYNDKVNQIKSLQGDILGLHSDVSRLRQRAVCQRSKNRMPEGGNSSIHADTSTNDDAEFSNEFDEFLKSQAIRDKLNTIWIESAVKAINKLCNQSNVECQK